MTWPLIAMAVAVAAGAAVALSWPFGGLLIYLWLDFIRLSDTFVELRSVRSMLVIGAATVAGTLWHQRGRWRAGTRALLPAAVVVAIAAASVLVSVDRQTSLGAFIELGKMLTVVWLMQQLLQRQWQVRAVLAVLVASLAVLAAHAVPDAHALGLFTTAPTKHFIQGPAGLHDGSFRDNNDLARVLVLVAPLGWALVAAPGPRWLRGGAGVALAIIIAGIEATFSRTGCLALLVAAAVVAISYWPIRRGVMLWLLFVALLLAVSPRTYVAHVATVREPATVQGRVAIWRSAAPAVEHRPLLGQGIGTFRHSEDGVARARRPSHNIFVEVGVELGLAGLAAYAWMILDALWRLWRLRVNPSSAFARAAAVGIAAALLGDLAAGLSLSQPFGPPLFVLIGLALALTRAVAAPAAETD